MEPAEDRRRLAEDVPVAVVERDQDRLWREGLTALEPANSWRWVSVWKPRARSQRICAREVVRVDRQAAGDLGQGRAERRRSGGTSGSGRPSERRGSRSGSLSTAALALGSPALLAVVRHGGAGRGFSSRGRGRRRVPAGREHDPGGDRGRAGERDSEDSQASSPNPPTSLGSAVERRTRPGLGWLVGRAPIPAAQPDGRSGRTSSKKRRARSTRPGPLVVEVQDESRSSPPRSSSTSFSAIQPGGPGSA